MALLQLHPTRPRRDRAASASTSARHRPRGLIAAIGLLVGVAVTGSGLVLRGDGIAGSSGAPAVTTSAADPGPLPAGPALPAVDGDVRLTDPAPTTTPTTTAPTSTTPSTTPTTLAEFDGAREAVRAFAANDIGFDDPVVGRVRRTGEGTGEVAVRSAAGGSITLITVERDGFGWAIRGARSNDLTLTRPVAGAAVVGSLPYAGRARSPEGDVELWIEVDGARSRLAETRIPTAGWTSPDPIEGVVGWWRSTSGEAMVIAVTRGADGEVRAAAAVPIQVVG